MLRKYRSARSPRSIIPLALVFLAILCILWLIDAWLIEARQAPLSHEPLLLKGPTGGPEIRLLMADGSYINLALEELLVGVVAGEMPASFEPQALGAQAIAARTYVLSHSAAYGSPRHKDADICGDSSHCQAYATIEQLQKTWGENFPEHYQAICQAIRETAGLAIFYQERLAETPYCSTCGGSTQRAQDVWGADIPYLQSVPCLWDSHSPRAVGAELLTLQAAAQALGVQPADLSQMKASYTPGGAIEYLQVAGEQLGGLELRQKLGLDSAACHWLIEGENILFSTRGYGHGVGLCQYGADGLAQAGYTAGEIIAYYYQGVSLRKLY